MKLGKAPARPRATDLLFATYRTSAPLPKRPRTFGHDAIIPTNGWKTLANDRVGCCVFSGFAHMVMLWNKIRGVDVEFSDESVLSDYAAVTGYTPKDPSTDQGTDVHDALDYFRKTGVVDASGKRHKIAAYVSLEAANLSEAYEAMYLFDGIASGFDLPKSAESQFAADKPWSVVSNSPSVGGHFVPPVALGAGPKIHGITWGRDQLITPGFYRAKNDESFAVFSEEYLDDKGLSPEHFNKAALLADIAALG